METAESMEIPIKNPSRAWTIFMLIKNVRQVENHCFLSAKTFQQIIVTDRLINLALCSDDPVFGNDTHSMPKSFIV